MKQGKAHTYMHMRRSRHDEFNAVNVERKQKKKLDSYNNKKKQQQVMEV